MDVQKLDQGRTQYFFKPGIREKLTWFRNGLAYGWRGDRCSLCGLLIRSDQEPWRIIDVGKEARLHFRCFWLVVEIRKEVNHAVVVAGDDQGHVHTVGARDTGLSGGVGVVGLAPVEAIGSGAAKAAGS